MFDDDTIAKFKADDPEETSVEDKEAVDAKTVRSILYAHRDIDPPDVSNPRELADRTHAQVVETVRWFFAINDVYDTDTRRKAAQQLVADHTESPHEDSDTLTLQAVQEKVRYLFDDRTERESTQSAQDLFDDVLDDVEDAYNARMENR